MGRRSSECQDAGALALALVTTDAEHTAHAFFYRGGEVTWGRYERSELWTPWNKRDFCITFSHNIGGNRHLNMCVKTKSECPQGDVLMTRHYITISIQNSSESRDLFYLIFFAVFVNKTTALHCVQRNRLSVRYYSCSVPWFRKTSHGEQNRSASNWFHPPAV